LALLPIDEAITQILNGLQPLDSQSEALEQAYGRVLAEPVLADRDQPPFNRSMMDGYALRSADAQTPGTTLGAVGTVTAGNCFEGTVGSGEAVRIMTGAPVPEGADAVEMFENVTVNGNRVVLERAVVPGANIALRGEELGEGEVAVDAGVRLTAARLGLCWKLGAGQVTVVRAPKIVILSTGDELVGLRQQPGDSQIRDSNAASVGAMVQRAGGLVLRSQRVVDDEAVLRRAIRAGLNDADVLVLSGGVSQGDTDLVGPALVSEGVTCVFHKVRIKPGKPVWYGRLGEKQVFGLPGNPVSSMVTARLFLLPAIRRLAGRCRLHDVRFDLPLLNDQGPTGSRPTFQPATVQWGHGVTMMRTRGSGDLAHFSAGSALAYLPANHKPFSAGESVSVLVDHESFWD
jgi:molybdopterin molybdotransferase